MLKDNLVINLTTEAVRHRAMSGLLPHFGHMMRCRVYQRYLYLPS